ncbi:rna polymerase : : Sigma70_r4_2 [Tuwongella immobilis]|uniref:Rna polymerase:: Sigma70_r4_2 n=2 Tax=Tuwongella immobilis TaxID=692036 RepID=A0A6C2YPN4_9BACT|nr:rna polymerase : : Sigma70_r4_2 [Tuwongella immobilis]VTS03366.1 rna polymerase : : Sigma70_r4_2 [Tuwongella immobilis]
MEESEWARLLKPLTPHQRKILSLRYRIGLSEKEVAIMLGLSESTIGTTCAHCIRELRSLFSHTNTRLAAAS